MTRIRLQLAVLTIFTSFVLGVDGQAAWAGHGAQLPTPNSRNELVDRNDLIGTSDVAVRHGIDQLNRTVINASLEGSGDVEVYDGYYGTSGIWEDVAGKADCMEYTQFYEHCLLYMVRFNLTYTANYSTNASYSLGCHEFGHTVGLGHRSSTNDGNDNSCMRKNIDASRPNYDTHDIGAINDTN